MSIGWKKFLWTTFAGSGLNSRRVFCFLFHFDVQCLTRPLHDWRRDRKTTFRWKKWISQCWEKRNKNIHGTNEIDESRRTTSLRIIIYVDLLEFLLIVYL